MDWSEDALYAKAKQYMRRALEEDVASDLHPLWTIVAMELLCRAALARLNPALLADPREGHNVLYACGIAIDKSPKSIPAKALFERCRAVMSPDFNSEVEADCLRLVDLRNAELHSGRMAFAGLNNSLWLPQSYQIISVALKYLGKTFEDILGKLDAEYALKVIAEYSAEKKKLALKKIGEAKGAFEKLDASVRETNAKEGSAKASAYVSKNNLSKLVKCPACGADAVVRGEISGRGEPVLKGNDLVVEARILPSRFGCVSCGLKLSGSGALQFCGLGNVYTRTEYLDVMDFFGIDPREYVDEGHDPYDAYDYAND